MAREGDNVDAVQAQIEGYSDGAKTRASVRA
jgi:hypothetical protein